MPSTRGRGKRARRCNITKWPPPPPITKLNCPNIFYVIENCSITQLIISRLFVACNEKSDGTSQRFSEVLSETLSEEAFFLGGFLSGFKSTILKAFLGLNNGLTEARLLKHDFPSAAIDRH